MPVAVVTGSHGFIGRAVTERLRAAGHHVRGIDLVPGDDTVAGDVSRPGRWREALDGADLVVHTAAIVAEDGDRDRFVAVNVGGTVNVIAAARDAGVRRVVHLSSKVVYGARFTGRPDETAPLVPSGAPYTDTKITSEHAALRLAAEGGIEVTIVRPGDVYGPGSVPWTIRPVTLLRRGLFTLPDGGRGVLAPVHVRDLADGIARAGTTPDAAGRIYNLTGEGVTAATFFRPYATHLGVPLRTAPAALLHAASALLQRGYRLAGREAPFSPAALEYVSHPGDYDTTRARTELGWVPQLDLGAGLADTLAWVDTHLPA